MGHLPAGIRRHVARTTKWWTSRWVEAPPVFTPPSRCDDTPRQTWVCIRCDATSDLAPTLVATADEGGRGPLGPACNPPPRRPVRSTVTPLFGLGVVTFAVCLGGAPRHPRSPVDFAVVWALSGSVTAVLLAVGVRWLLAPTRLRADRVWRRAMGCLDAGTESAAHEALALADPVARRCALDDLIVGARDPRAIAVLRSVRARLELWSPTDFATLAAAARLSQAAVRSMPWSPFVLATHALALAQEAAWGPPAQAAGLVAGARSALAEADARAAVRPEPSLAVVAYLIEVLHGGDASVRRERERAELTCPDLLRRVEGLRRAAAPESLRGQVAAD